MKRLGRSLDPAWRVADRMEGVSSFGTRGNARMSFGRVDRAVEFCRTAPKLRARFRDRAIRDREVIESADRDLADVHGPDPEGVGPSRRVMSQPAAPSE